VGFGAEAPISRALVTGCAGFIGSHLTESLLEDGCRVVGVDCFNGNYARPEKLRNLERARSWDNFDFVPIDLARGELHEFVADCDVVFHLAAEPGVRSSWGDRFETYVRNNVLATQHLLDAARTFPAKRLVYASSSSIYGEAETMPTREDMIPKPRSPYGVTKLAAEHLCSTYHANFGVNAVSLRYFSVYGPRQRPDMAFSIFCSAAINGDPITVFGDGTQTRDFTYVSDVVAATRSAAVAPGVSGNVYNVGGGGQTSLNDGIARIEELAGRSLIVDRVGREHGDVQDTRADTSRAEADLGMNGRMAFEDGIRMEFEWHVEEARRLASSSAR
jgi:UDP-glucuronate 4-epimerase